MLHRCKICNNTICPICNYCHWCNGVKMLHKCEICDNTICPVCYYCHRCNDAKRGEDINFFNETFILDKKTAKWYIKQFKKHNVEYYDGLYWASIGEAVYDIETGKVIHKKPEQSTLKEKIMRFINDIIQ